MLRQSRDVRRSTKVLWAAIVVSAMACTGDESVRVIEGVIDRETFIEVYVDLRAETLSGPDVTLPDEQRDGILARHGVDAAGLLGFVDAYGRELDFMNRVWAEIEQRLDARPASPEPSAPPASR